MKAHVLLLAAITALALFSCSPSSTDDEADFALTDSLLNTWHKAAAEADSVVYFGMMDSSCVFIGTDPGERWNYKAFRAYVMPFFRDGRGWDFKALERNFRKAGQGDVILFDERLDTWMGPILTTGIMEMMNGEWKIIHYQLGFTVPNEQIREVIKMLEDTSQVAERN